MTRQASLLVEKVKYLTLVQVLVIYTLALVYNRHVPVKRKIPRQYRQGIFFVKEENRVINVLPPVF
jgi:hypothetical protein